MGTILSAAYVHTQRLPHARDLRESRSPRRFRRESADEHLLNQTMVRLFNCGRSFSSHIEKKRSKCDYHFTRDLTAEEVAEIEKRVNQIIAADLPMREEFIDRAAAQARYNISRLPDAAGDSIRVVHIGHYDSCPCSGAHASSSGLIERFQIVSTSHADGVLRVRFKIGGEGNGPCFSIGPKARGTARWWAGRMLRLPGGLTPRV